MLNSPFYLSLYARNSDNLKDRGVKLKIDHDMINTAKWNLMRKGNDGEEEKGIHYRIALSKASYRAEIQLELLET